ncbi:MAG TPA: tetratricopeptide repeat protein [Candidatus Sulfotelmatobacter sp.]|nr:tetratricopeptide repeat protein [Candidatus Sulfotelmatobacter sp.]
MLGFVLAAASAQTSHIEAATQLLSNGDTARAEAEARKALQIPSTRALALAMLGTIRLQQGNTDESIKYLTQSLTLNPKLVGARTTLGNAYAFSNKPDLAVKSFREVLRIDPGNFNARFDLFKLEAAQRNFQQSLDQAAPILPQLLQSDEGIAVLASDYGALGKNTELADLAGYWKRLPDPSDEAAMGFSGTLLTYGMMPEATAVMEEQEKRPASRLRHDTALRMAQAFAVLGLLEHAESNAQLALSQNPDCTACYLTLAQIAERQSNSEKALSFLVQAKRLAPQDPQVLFEFGRVCLERNLLDDALPALSKAVDLKPDNDSFVYALGSANVGKGRLPDALDLFERLLLKHPQDAGLMYAIGAVYYLQGKFNDAEASLKQSLAAQPNQVAAAYYLALTYNAIGDDDRAIPIFRDLIKKNPQHVPSYVKLGGILVRQHEYEEAQRDLEQALSLDPDSVEAHYQLGLVLRRLGKSAESETQFAESRRLETEQRAQKDLHLRLLLPD